MLTKKEIINILEDNNTIVSLEQFLQIEESDIVTSVEHNGMSGNFVNCAWYSVTCINDEEYQVYVLSENN